MILKKIVLIVLILFFMILLYTLSLIIVHKHNLNIVSLPVEKKYERNCNFINSKFFLTDINVDKNDTNSVIVYINKPMMSIKFINNQALRIGDSYVLWSNSIDDINKLLTEQNIKHFIHNNEIIINATVIFASNNVIIEEITENKFFSKMTFNKTLSQIMIELKK